MAGEGTKERTSGAGETKSGAKIDIVSVVIFLLLCINLVTVGGLGYFLNELWSNFQNLKVQTRELAAKTQEEDLLLEENFKQPELGILFPIESFLVNINSAHGPKFLQAQLEFELKDPQLENEIAQKKPAIRDAIIVLLSSRTYEELRDPTGMQKLRTDLLRSVNNLLSNGNIKALYFTQFHFN